MIRILLIALFFFGTAFSDSVSYAQDIECVPDNTIRSDPGFAKYYDLFRTRLEERLREMQVNKSVRDYWGRFYDGSTAVYGLYWIDGLDPFSVEVIKNPKKKSEILINATSVTSQRTYKPIPKAVKSQKAKKNRKGDIEETDEPRSDLDRTELHISMDISSAAKKVSNCLYEIRGTYVYIRLNKSASGSKSDFGEKL